MLNWKIILTRRKLDSSHPSWPWSWKSRKKKENRKNGNVARNIFFMKKVFLFSFFSHSRLYLLKNDPRGLKISTKSFVKLEDSLVIKILMRIPNDSFCCSTTSDKILEFFSRRSQRQTDSVLWWSSLATANYQGCCLERVLWKKLSYHWLMNRMTAENLETCQLCSFESQ